MFQFDNVLTAGTVLVRDQIESQNYAPSGGTLGWAILADGTSFFFNTTVRGVFTTGVAPNPRVVIDTGPAGPGLKPAYGRERFYTGVVAEVTPAELSALADAFGRTTVHLNSNDMGFGTTNIRLTTADSAGSDALITLQNQLTNGRKLFVDIEGQLSAADTPYGYVIDTTTRSTASASYVGVAGQTTQLTLPVPRSNKFLLQYWALTNNATAGANTMMSAEVRDGSLAGAVLDAASDVGAVRNNNTGNAAGMGFRYVDLSASPPSTGQIYVRDVFRVSAGTGNYVQSSVCVIPLM